MDWQTKGDTQLENLPTREKLHDDSRGRYQGDTLPYARLMRWLESQEGKNIDSVIHDFVRLDWLLPVYRTMEQLRKRIEMTTFVNGEGQVCYHSNYARWGKEQVIQDEAVKTIYVHPVSRCLCVHHPRTRKSYQKRRQEELDARVRFLGDYHQLYKMDGIWYEVKGEVRHKYFSPFFKQMMSPPNCERKGPREILMEANGYWERSHSDKNYVEIVLRRQLSHKELKKHGLRNDAPSVDSFVCPRCGGDKGDCLHEKFKRAEARVSRYS